MLESQEVKEASRRGRLTLKAASQVVRWAPVVQEVREANGHGTKASQ